jgi:murein DD-endopeptidase MepM/ murein hydrolase activator NlpD
MGVTASTMVRTAFVGGLASMGVCLMLIGANLQSHKIKSHFPPALSQFEAPLPPMIAAGTLPAPVAIVAKPAATPAPQSQFVHFRGSIQSSLFEAALAQGVPPALLSDMIKVFSYDVDFQRDIQPDDQFELIYERGADKKAPNKLIYASLTLSGKPIALYRYTDLQGVTDYYTRDGESARKALLKTPVDGARISSGFGRRFHPILHYTTQHKGIDFAVMTGTPVMAAGNGVVETAGSNGAYGLYVKIKHDASHETAYAHLSRLAPGIRPGHQVTQGQTIGLSGSTGRSTGPHLHYEVLVNDSQTNPMSVKFQSGRKLTGKELARFQAVEKQDGALLAQTAPTTRNAGN